MPMGRSRVRIALHLVRSKACNLINDTLVLNRTGGRSLLGFRLGATGVEKLVLIRDAYAYGLANC